MVKKLGVLFISLFIMLQVCMAATVTIKEGFVSYSFDKSADHKVYVVARTPAIQKWEVESGGVSLDPENNPNTSFTMGASNVVLKAIYNSYTVTLDNQGATTAGTTSVTAIYASAMPVLITIPKKEYKVTYDYKEGSGSPDNETASYTFGGYYSRTEGNGVQYYTSAGTSARKWDIANNATLYAKWTPTSVTLPTPTRTGYTFRGWYSDAAYTNSVGDAGAAYTPTAPITLYAKWEANQYTVTLDGQNATTAGTTSVTATYASAMPVPITVPERKYKVTYDYKGGTGSPDDETATYTFGGYYTLTEGSGTQYYTSSGTSARNWDIASNTTLYAKWTPTSVTLPTPTRTGYDFKGWYKEAAYTNSAGNGGAAYTPTADITLYAKWEMTDYTVTLTNDPTAGGTASVTGGNPKHYEDTVTITATANAGYRFIGWEVTSGSVTLANANALTTTFTMPASNVDIKAKWKAIIYGDADDNGEVDIFDALAIQQWLVGWDVTIVFENSDVNLDGVVDWYDQQIILCYDVGWDIDLPYDGKVVLYWTTNDVTTANVACQLFEAGETKALNPSSTFTKDGYQLIGWSTTYGGSKVYDVGGNYTANNNMTLYPVWEALYTVLLTSDPTAGGTVTGGGDYLAGATVTIAATANTGYRFAGWTAVSGGASLANASATTTTFTMPASDVSITANWGLYGDANDDGVVDGRDSIRIRNYLLGEVVTIDLGNSDVNLDGVVDWYDYCIIMNYLLDGFELPYNGKVVIYWEDPNDTNMIGQLFETGETKALDPNTDFSNDGYELIGWSTTYGGSKVYDLGANYTANSNITLYPVWEAVQTDYTLTLTSDPTAGGTVTGGGTYSAGDRVTITATANAGYRFGGWEVTSGSLTLLNVYANSASTTFTMPSSDVTIKAKWKVKGAWNEPLLASGLTPVNWNGSSWIQVSEPEWDYNYNLASAWNNTVAGDGTAMWANAQTADGSLYVWIPRFTYKKTEGNKVSWNSDATGTKTGKTEIKFSTGTTDDTSGSYSKHPAFTLKNKSGTVENELTGFWVAKYEASNQSGKPGSIPEATAWVSITVSNAFTNSKNLNTSLGSHLLKYDEWGAVSYLTSALGRIPYVNNSSPRITGSGADSLESGTAYKWNTAYGVRGSTTHNVYGVYDMSFGVAEFVAGCYSSVISSSTTNRADLVSSYNSDGTKYVTSIGEWGDSDIGAVTRFDGDATSQFSTTNCIPVRGAYGIDDLNSLDGMFAFAIADGAAHVGNGFRVGLWALGDGNTGGDSGGDSGGGSDTCTHSWSGYQYIDLSGHAKKCSLCGATDTKYSHNTNGGYNKNDNSHWALCSTCGGQGAASTPHSYTQKTNSSYHWEACVCGNERNKGLHTNIRPCEECGYE